MVSYPHLWGRKKQFATVLACSILLTIYYSCLDLCPLWDRPSFHLYGTENISYYLVDSDHCKIPNLDPHHWSIRKIIKKHSYISCRNSLPHLVRLRRQETAEAPQFRLEIDKKAAPKYFHGGVTCCYEEVHRVDESDDEITKDSAVCFKESTVLSNTTQMVTVTCYKYFNTLELPSKNSTLYENNTLYENMFYIILHTESVKAKMRNQDKNRKLDVHGTVRTLDEENKNSEELDGFKENLNHFTKQKNDLKEKVGSQEEVGSQSETVHKNKERNSKKLDGFEENLNRSPVHKNNLKAIVGNQEEDLSILIIGIDSMSRLNLIRAMPQTRKFLDRNGWFELEGYNKIGDNTLPNLLAVLSGRSYEDVKASCNPGMKGYFDACPMIWSDLNRKGYITSFAEDLAAISTFNLDGKGFRQQPTDYYWRPLLLAGERGFKCLNMGLQHSYCVGSSMEAELLMEYTQRFVMEFQNYSYFSFVWMNAFSHNDLNAPSRMDQTVFRFLSDLNSSALQNTAVLFLSDHGMRSGPIRRTYVGWFEERLPFVFFRLPSWYQTKYPDKIENLRRNKNSLTTPYDVYHTLNELTRLSNRSACENCSSLLQRVDKHRACSDLRIARLWCTCREMIQLSASDPRGNELGQVLVRHIDAMLVSHRDSVETGYHCANLTLSKVLSLQTNKNPFETDLFIVQVEAAPSNALFDAMIVRKQGGYEVEGAVSRLNMYKKEGACLKDNTLRLYCYCVPG